MSKYLPSIIIDEPVALEKEAQQITNNPDWFAEFQHNLKMTQANPYDSLHEQIHSIMNGSKPKFSSVQEMVEDLQERTGLKKFLESKKAEEFTNLVQKSAGISEFEKIPEMKTFIDNYVGDRPGTSIDAVIRSLLKDNDISSKLEDANDASDDVKRYINNKIIENRKDDTDKYTIDSHLGKVDVLDSNDSEDEHNPLAFCEPTKFSSLKLRFIK